MTVTWAVMVGSFGRKGLTRLAVCAVLSAMTSLALTQGIVGLVLRPLPHPAILLFPVLLSTQLVVLATLAAASGVSGRKDNLVQLLHYLPLPSTVRQLYLLLPSAVLAGLAVGAVSLPFGMVFCKLGMPAWLFIGAECIGIVTSVGLMRAFGARQWTALAVAPLWLYVQYRLVQIVLSPVAPGAARTVAAVTILGITVYMMGRCLSRQQPSQAERQPRSYATWLPPWSWHAKKVARAPTARLGIAVAFGLSSLAAAISWRSTLLDASTLALGMGVIAASCTSDIRGLTRRHTPPDIAALDGTARFSWRQLVSASIAGCVATTPLIIALGQQELQAITVIAQLMLGVGAGVLASTAFVPTRRDGMGQFAATACCTLLVIGVPQVPWLSTYSPVILQFLLALLMLAIALGIEQYRNNFRWKRT